VAQNRGKCNAGVDGREYSEQLSDWHLELPVEMFFVNIKNTGF
jgi:hypothetical protein